jgi:hypothetical protein
MLHFVGLGRIGEGNVGVRGRRCWQGDLGAENTDRAGRYHRSSDLARRELRLDRDRGGSTHWMVNALTAGAQLALRVRRRRKI